MSSLIKCCYVATVPQLYGMVAEIKNVDNTSYPIWECFHNMSGVGAACITMKVLNQGFIVNHVDEHNPQDRSTQTLAAV